ncbi:putative DsbA family dithiol-disulfide isomerase [Streptosporangium album]|uniref:Putative DsbA family dithiol-disulfide isomerase n=1 Tax=Streptosporangium album TaxID=47479 RepID=A0A7W7RW27_9ACTN|nr:DsbA family oxidoreductase [Streptosporangium album]MBB4939304.1 putative DsbA family dithiol-disulfide isomerase [Streptosporangium album]
MKRIEVWADMVCAWAYIGKRRLEKAGFGEDVEIVWRPFQIDPMAPAPAEPLYEALRGPIADGALQACHPDLTPAENRVRVSAIAAEEGLGPPWGAVWRPNTFDAHRVIALAHQRGGSALQDAVVERILRAHFVEASDIGDRATLVALAAEAGLDGMAEALDAGEGVGEVRSQLLRGKAIGVATSPTYVAGGTAVAGAQSPEVLADLLRQAAPERELPDEVRLLRQAESLLDVRDPLGALRTLEPLLADHGDDPAVRLLAARAYFGSAQLGRARETLESLLDRAPGDHYVRFLLGRTLERANRHAEALPHLRLAAAMSADPGYADALRRVESRVP